MLLFFPPVLDPYGHKAKRQRSPMALQKLIQDSGKSKTLPILFCSSNMKPLSLKRGLILEAS